LVDYGVLRYIWAAPATVLGAMIAAVASPRASAAIVDGVLEVHGPVLRWMLGHLVPIEGGASAITLGHVVIGASARALDATRAHERVHVRQYERWGPLFLPAYGAASLWAAVNGRDAYVDNVFERRARRDGALGG
jgi:hypothetical protein